MDHNVEFDVEALSKTEAAILADNISAWCSEHDHDDRDLIEGMGRLLIAEAISRGMHEAVPGSYLNRAALARPSDRTVRIAYKRALGLL